MSGLAAKWAVRRYQPSIYREGEGNTALVPAGEEQIFDNWRAVCKAADCIVGDNCLRISLEPVDPVVIQHGQDVVLIYRKLEF